MPYIQFSKRAADLDVAGTKQDKDRVGGACCQRLLSNTSGRVLCKLWPFGILLSSPRLFRLPLSSRPQLVMDVSLDAVVQLGRDM